MIAVIRMPKDRKQMMRDLEKLKGQVESLVSKNNTTAPDGTEGNISSLLKYMVEERERTNRMLEGLTDKIRKLEGALDGMYAVAEEREAAVQARPIDNKEIPLSGLDAQVLDFVQTKGMICADQLKEYMGYKGRNAACTRLNKLYTTGLLDRFQLGHKVYYKYAGKATNTLIISPPQ